MDAKTHLKGAQKYKARSGDMILQEMAGAAEKISPEHFRHVGELCRLYCEIDDFLDDHKDCVGTMGGSEDDVHEELMGAEKYMRKWQETGDIAFQSLAKDELRHAKMLLDRDTSLPEDKKKHYKMLHDQMAARLG